MMISGFSFYMKAFLVAAFLSGCFIIYSCENDPKTINTWTKNKVMTEEAKGVVSYLSQHGIMKAKLTAPLMIRVLADTVYVEFPKNLHVDFYDSTNNIESRLYAKYGKYFETLNKVYLRDSVVVINIKGDTLKSPDLWWDQNKQIFYTDKYAIYHGANEKINGTKGLTATQDLKSVIFGQPTGTVLVSDNGIPK